MNTKIKQLDNGTWMINTLVKVDGKWKHLCKRGYRTLSEAKADYIRVEQDFIKRMSPKTEQECFDYLLDRYIKWRSKQINESTLQTDTYIYNLYFKSYFNNERIQDCFTREKISEWYNDLVNNDEVSDKRKLRVIAKMKDFIKFTYNQMFIDAKTYQLCDTAIQPIKDKTKPKDKIIWTDEELARFMDACKENEDDFFLFNLYVNTGCRIGEFLAIQVGCIDFENKRLDIHQQAIELREQGKTIISEVLKTKESYRKILLSDTLLEQCKQYIFRNKLLDKHFLFYTTSKSRPLGRNTLRRKILYYANKAGVPYINPHNIRHLSCTIASRYCKTMDQLEAIAKRFGHSPSIFLNTYAKHSNEDVEKYIVNQMVAF